MRRRFDLTAVDGLALVAVVAAGTALRIPGLTSRDLWFDDAWAALPTKVPLGTAARMVVTTPLYTFAVRSWILLHPGATWWAQLPALVLGIAGIVAVFGLLRSFGFQRAYAYAAAVIVAVGPVTVTYSTRVKEYPADLLFACLVLWLADRWRRSPTPVRIAALGIASAIAIATSASTAAAVGGAVVLAVAMALPRRELRAQTAGLVAGLAATTILLYLAWLRHIPEQLRSNWRTHGFIVGYASLHEVAYSFQSVASGLTHGLLGVPITYTFSASALLAESMLLAVTTAIAIAALVLAPLVRAARSKGGDVDVTFSSAAGMVLGVLGAAAGLSPLGDGRTDEVFYPMLLVLGAGGLSWAVAALRRRSPRTSHQTRAMRAACAAIVAACALWFGVSHRATYPPTGLTVVTSQLRGHLPQGRPHRARRVRLVHVGHGGPGAMGGVVRAGERAVAHGVPRREWRPRGDPLAQLPRAGRVVREAREQDASDLVCRDQPRRVLPRDTAGSQPVPARLAHTPRPRAARVEAGLPVLSVLRHLRPALQPPLGGRTATDACARPADRASSASRPRRREAGRQAPALRRGCRRQGPPSGNGVHRG